jgi:hypothetical protein
MACILCNTTSLAMFHDGQSEEWIRMYSVFEVLFTVIFTLGTAHCEQCLCAVVFTVLSSWYRCPAGACGPIQLSLPGFFTQHDQRC